MDVDVWQDAVDSAESIAYTAELYADEAKVAADDTLDRLQRRDPPTEAALAILEREPDVSPYELG